MLVLAYKYKNVKFAAKVTYFIELTKEYPNYLEFRKIKYEF